MAGHRKILNKIKKEQGLKSDHEVMTLLLRLYRVTRVFSKGVRNG